MKGKTLALLAVLALAGTAVGAVTFVDVSGDITLQTNSGVAVTSDDHGGGLATSNPFPDNQTVDYVSQNGNVTVSANSSASLFLSSITGPTTVTNLTAVGTNVTLQPETSDTLTVAGEAASVSWDTVAVDDGSSDVTIQVDNGEQVNVTVDGLVPGENYRATDGSTILDTTTADGSGSATFEFDTNATATLETYENSVPTVSDLSPDGDVVSDPITVSADIDDDSLPTENVTVTFRLDGSVVQTTEIDSAGRVQYTLTQSELPGAGSTDWSVTATDSLGGEATEAASFGIASNITVRNVSAPTQTISGAEVTIYGPDRTYDRTSDANGNISLAGLPGGVQLFALINQTDYYSRTVPIGSVVQAGDAYLIPQNESVVLDRFTLEDATGDFSQDSVVYIERPINQSGTPRYKTVAGDEFGVEGFTATLKQDQRYRIRIVAPNGNVAQMGSFTASTSETVPLRPQRPTVNLSANQTPAFNATVDGTDLDIQFVDAEDETDVATVYVVNRFNDSDYLVQPTTYYGASELSISEPIGQDGLQDSYVVVVEGQRDGESFRLQQPVGPDQISIVPAGLDLVWIQIPAIGIIMLVGGLFSRLNVGAGAVVTSLLGGVLWYFGLMQGVASWALMAMAITFAVLYGMVSNT